MAQTAAQRKRAQRAQDIKELKEIKWKLIEQAKGHQKKIVINKQPQLQPVEQPQAIKPSTKNLQKTKGNSTTSKSATTGCKRLCAII
jgi:hypothetical protein